MKNVVKSSNRWLRMTALSLALLATATQTQMGHAKDDKMPMDGQTRDAVKSVAPDHSKMNMGEGEMDIVHPFFTHMGMPDPVGHYALRLSGVSSNSKGHNKGDFGFHLETGLAKNWGLHIRNDQVRGNAHTEVAFQYAAIRSRDGMSGVSPFIEIELPTGKGEKDTFALIGFSTAWTTKRLAFNQSLEYSPRENAIEGSAAIVAKIGERFFPVVEFIGGAAKGALPENSVIGGLKYRFKKNLVGGVGYRVPVASAREFNNQVMVQMDIEW